MEFNVKKTELKVVLGDVTYNARTPTLAESEQLNIEMQNFSGVDVFKVYYRFFEKLGLPEDAVKQNLDAEQFNELIKFLLAPKKTLKEAESL